MTAHELGRYLLECAPDLPVVINGWGSDEGMEQVVTGAGLGDDGTVYLGHGGDVWDGEKYVTGDWCMRGERLEPPKG